MEAPSANEPNNKNNTEGNSSKPSYSEVCLEEQTVVLLPDSSKTALVSPHKTNKTTTDLEKSSQETRVCRFVLLFYPKHFLIRNPIHFLIHKYYFDDMLNCIKQISASQIIFFLLYCLIFGAHAMKMQKSAL